ncbi:MAG: 2-hydroxychromene-2-carboxylate isomerase [Caulobacterales bacterium]|jgi:2-hydroxychromene-2-carboxylate isomerase
MALSFDMFWSFRSPYSYLATKRIVGLEQRYDMSVNVRPVYPLAVRVDGFFKKVDPLWVRYLARDTFRIAQMEGLPYGPPRPDPIVMDMATGDVSKDQPYIHRLTRLGMAAVERGRGLAFLDEVSTLIWGGGTDDWTRGDQLAQATARAGLELADLDAAAIAHVDRFEAAIEANQNALADLGHWGVPTFGFMGEPFFGQDRIDALIWRMKQHGLVERT